MMKGLYFILIFVVALASCDESTSSSEKVEGEKTSQPAAENVAENQPEQAEKEGEVLRINPSDADTVVPLSEMQSKEMQDAKAAYNAGVDFYDRGQTEQALEQFKTSLEYFPENGPKAAHYLGRIYFEKGDKELALSYYEDAIRYDPVDSVSILSLGQVYFDMQNFEKAMEYYNKAIEAGPAYGLAYYNRGTLLGMQNEYMLALDDLNKSIRTRSEKSQCLPEQGLGLFLSEKPFRCLR